MLYFLVFKRLSMKTGTFGGLTGEVNTRNIQVHITPILIKPTEHRNFTRVGLRTMGWEGKEGLRCGEIGSGIDIRI